MSRAGKEAGFSLMEAIVAVGILAIILGSLIPSFVYYGRTNANMETRMQAVTVAQQVLDQLRTVDPTTLPSSGTTTSNTAVGNRTFTVKTYYCLQAGYCGTNTRDITVEVDFNGNQVYRTETVYTKLQ